MPDTLIVLACPAEVPDALRWPFEDSIPAMQDTMSDDRVVVCLSGDEVEPAWQLLGGGINTAHVPVFGGEMWDETLRINWPGYRLTGDPCGEDGLSPVG